MNADSHHSVSQWIAGAKAGDSEAVRQLWERYFKRLAKLAQKKLAGQRQRMVDGEDVALSAFTAFCRGAEEGRFPQLVGRDDLWRLLLRLTAQKALDQRRHASRAKRGGGRVAGESGVELDDIIGESPTPEFAALVAEEYDRLLRCLPDDELRAVAVAKMEGYTNQEIAAQLKCCLSTVERRLRLIHGIWQQAISES